MNLDKLKKMKEFNERQRINELRGIKKPEKEQEILRKVYEHQKMYNDVWLSDRKKSPVGTHLPGK